MRVEMYNGYFQTEFRSILWRFWRKWKKAIASNSVLIIVVFPFWLVLMATPSSGNSAYTNFVFDRLTPTNALIWAALILIAAFLGLLLPGPLKSPMRAIRSLHERSKIIFEEWEKNERLAAARKAQRKRRKQQQKEKAAATNEQRAPRESRSREEIIFGIPIGASIREIKQTYRHLAAKYHPDTLANTSPEKRSAGEEKMKTINAAYDVLKRR